MCNYTSISRSKNDIASAKEGELIGECNNNGRDCGAGLADGKNACQACRQPSRTQVAARWQSQAINAGRPGPSSRVCRESSRVEPQTSGAAPCGWYFHSAKFKNPKIQEFEKWGKKRGNHSQHECVLSANGNSMRIAEQASLMREIEGGKSGGRRINRKKGCPRRLRDVESRVPGCVRTVGKWELCMRERRTAEQLSVMYQAWMYPKYKPHLGAAEAVIRLGLAARRVVAYRALDGVTKMFVPPETLELENALMRIARERGSRQNICMHQTADADVACKSI
ncbi:hypothetical protein FIBSPDRAFT_901032 [Athelia psychrophila]|uniref:Uncharacterized protein n=1 Tax=Athelia psychrophila TaxID=1759441 RepID=A0A165XMR1_9AGAM|nr:hypothetical protein FIBSPDRAFT_901032 [Fibularhizoctonia sp. CBS 109695]